MAQKIIYTGAGDGYLGNRANPGSGSGDWNAAHDGTSANFVTDYTSATFVVGIAFTDRYYLYRGAVPFSLSTIPNNAIIKAATVSLYATAKADEDNDGDDWINIVGPTNTASDTTLTANDFNDIGSVDDPQELATRIDIGNISTSAYNTWTLNSAGIALIQSSIGGYVKLGVREGHDCLDNQPATNQTNVTFSASEQSGTSQDPRLTVTYSLPGGLLLF